MDEPYSNEWWRWRMYRKIADYLYDPTPAAQADIYSILREYQLQQQQAAPHRHRDEHEWAMDWQ